MRMNLRMTVLCYVCGNERVGKEYERNLSAQVFLGSAGGRMRCCCCKRVVAADFLDDPEYIRKWDRWKRKLREEEGVTETRGVLPHNTGVLNEDGNEEVNARETKD